MVRGPCSSCPHLTPFVTRLVSDLRCFPSVDRLATPPRPKTYWNRYPSGQETLAAPKDAAAFRPSGLVPNPTGKPVVSSGWPKMAAPRLSALPFAPLPPSSSRHARGWWLASLGRVFKVSQRGALSHPRSGKCVRSTPATHRLIFSKTTARVSLHSEPPTSPTGSGDFPVLRWETGFGGSRSWLRGVFDLSRRHSTEPLALRRRPCVPSSSPSR